MDMGPKLGTLVVSIALLLCPPAFGQWGRGQLLVEIHDPTGAGLPGDVTLISAANQVRRAGKATAEGSYSARELQFGVYHLTVEHSGFAPADALVEIRSEVPVKINVSLSIAAVMSQVEVSDSATIVDPRQTSTIYTIGVQAISEKMSAQPGRAISDLVNDQPGWLYEANGVLHPRGLEYGVQYVVDGLPLTENRSPAYAPPLQADDAESLRMQTSGYPAEYGRKLGGVVEINTAKQPPAGLHGHLLATGGSFATGGGSGAITYTRTADQFAISGQEVRTDRYLDPPVLANYTNTGSFGGLAISYGRDFGPRRRLRLTFSDDFADFLVPNELVQQQAGQRQSRDNHETRGQALYQDTLSDHLLLTAVASIRDTAATLGSNALSIPIIVDQQRGFREGYASFQLAGHAGRHDWKTGVDAIFSNIHEALTYTITDPSQFDPTVSPQFGFWDRGHDREQAVFVQDELHLGHWNISAGSRFDHYHLLVDESAWSPRLALSRYVARLGLVLHASYDRVFETPAVENLLLASSLAVEQISPLVLRLPIRPARADFYEFGLTKSVLGTMSFNVNAFRRDFRDFPDDDVLLDTGVSFPTSFSRARVQGIESKLEVRNFHRFSGFLSYANQTALAQGPITGGLLLGAEIGPALANRTTFPATQDQRNTARARIRYQLTHICWLAAGASYGSGLPVEIDPADLNYASLLAQYGPRVLSRVNFARGRVRPSSSIDIGGGVDLYRKERKSISLTAEVFNITDRLNVIDFQGLFSGTALAPPRSATVGVRTEF